MSVRAIRGAVQVEANTPEAIAAGTKELLLEILRSNELEIGAIISVLLTATPISPPPFQRLQRERLALKPRLCSVQLKLMSLELCRG